MYLYKVTPIQNAILILSSDSKRKVKGGRKTTKLLQILVVFFTIDLFISILLLSLNDSILIVVSGMETQEEGYNYEQTLVCIL